MCVMQPEHFDRGMATACTCRSLLLAAVPPSFPAAAAGGRRSSRSPEPAWHVSCPAVEQDAEAPSTSGRAHTDSESLQPVLCAVQQR